ncbi:spondin-1-like [Schistocerca piceifrons]|uniref:spondin-1-like n=1 Tax=Schistocerca piceifrons TaxID=274613 RepID=UPI001F5F5848|nr:spondin-1-like [Schistocerca piceifrons]
MERNSRRFAASAPRLLRALALWWLAAALLVPPAAGSGGIDCRRTPDGSTTPRTQLVDDRFKITVSGNPDSYVPGERYLVKLQASRQLRPPSRFTGFMLTAEPGGEASLAGGDEQPPAEPLRYRHHGRGPHGAGAFSLYGDALTRFSDRCPNTVTQTSTSPKAEVQVLWTAPPAGSGCVVFRATVIERPDVWYMDDGPLSYTFCEEVHNSFDEQPPVQKECCACQEAKYELTFEGLWSRHTHPKGFPDDSFLAKFSDVIGASHTSDYYFWSYGARASPGLKQVAERGSTRELERELKAQSQEIRTIIKARGISFPNVTGKTFAVFRVDRKHHLVSIVSMIDPSPDWIVGVAGLELCLQDCTWVEYLELNLYPWDIGTDSGITYTSPNMPTVPQDVIRRITSSFPNNESSPFFDKTGAPMKPLARLYLTRQRLYEKSCTDYPTRDSGEMPENLQEECMTTPWSDWGPCSVTCGSGHMLRQRSFVDIQRSDASGCKQKLTSRKACTAAHRSCKSQPQEWECELSEWSEWSGCSNKCGSGAQMRSRQYKHSHYQKKCKVQRNAPKLQQTIACFGKESDDCSTTSEEEEEFLNNPSEDEDPNCRTTQWSEWSQCSATCGNGTRTRTRLLSSRDEDTRLMVAVLSDNPVDTTRDCSHVPLEQEVECQGDIPSCVISAKEAKEICQRPKRSGSCRGTYIRWFFDGEECTEFRYGGCRGNRNNFETKEECEEVCMSNMEDLKTNISARLQQYGVSLSGILSYNIALEDSTSSSDKSKLMNVNCGSDENEATENSLRGIEAGNFIVDSSPIYGLTSFPSVSDSINSLSTDKLSEEPVNCLMSEWSEWSPCSVTCGRGYKTRERHVLLHPTHGGKRCPSKRTRTKPCRKGRCDPTEVDDNPTWGEPYAIVTVLDNDCQLAEWSAWSHCSATCGHAYRQRTRSIIQPRKPGGAPCGARLQKEKCELPICKA